MNSPIIFKGKFDYYAFNALALEGLVLAFNAGEKLIVLNTDNFQGFKNGDFLELDCIKSLKSDGWKFIYSHRYLEL